MRFNYQWITSCIYDRIQSPNINALASDELRGRDQTHEGSLVMINSTKSSRKSKASYRKLLEDPRWQDKRHEMSDLDFFLA